LPAELNTINENKTCQIYKKSQIVFHEGCQPFGFYCINSGKVKITKRTSEGKEQIIRLAKQGDLIGYRSVLADSKYSASAIAMEDTVICYIPKDHFNSLILSNAKVGAEVIRMLSVALGNAEEKMARMALRPVKQRLAEALLLLSSIYNPLNNKDYEIVISRDDLASIVGTAKETAIRFLSELKSENIVTTHGSKIVILDINGLLRTGELLD
jgi:CRP-like cAMP-binding protein